MSDAPLPVVIAPHPIGWTARQDYWGGLPSLLRGHSRGWRGLAHRYGVILVAPHGHHRSVDLNSLAYGPQIDDFAQLIETLVSAGRVVDRSRVYTAGLSMGAQEALVFAGMYPGLVAAACAFNPVVDLAAWHDDLAVSDDPDIVAFGTAERIRREVGGAPQAVPAAYAARSPLHYAANLAQVPILLIWSSADFIVPRQSDRHALQLYRSIKAIAPHAPVTELEHTRIHGLSQIDRDAAWRLHEWCDYEMGLAWLLRHRRPGAEDPEPSAASLRRDSLS
jgi:pimeloyl-ACP methyl ester carboxylesterase